MRHWFYDLEDAFTIKELINYGKTDFFKIGFVEKREWEKVKQNILTKLAEMKHREYVFMFQFIANHYKLKYDRKDIGIFVSRILNDEFGIRHNKDRIREILKEEIYRISSKPTTKN